MKQRTKKRWQRSLAAALSFALLLPMTANLSVGAAGETASSGSQESLTLGSSGTWTPNYDRKPQNTKGDLTVDQLRTKQLDEKDIPEAVGEKTAREKDHAHRLYQQEEDMNTVIFQNRDGTKTMYYFAEPVKYKDETGKVKDKSNALTQRSDGSAETTQNDVRTRFPKDLSKDSGVTLSYQGRQITLSPAAGVGTARRVTYPKTDESLTDAVSYASVFGEGTTLRYTPTFEGFKEDIILDRYTGQSRFSFRLQTGGLTLVNDKGALSLCDPLTGNTAVDIGELVVYDSTGDMSAVMEGKYKHQYEVRTVKQDSEYILTMVVDEAYLKAKDTVYPVYVDPSFTINSFDFYTKNIIDAVVYKGYPYQNFGSATNMMVGYASSYEQEGRIFVQFPGLINNATFSSMAAYQIKNVSFHIYKTWDTHNQTSSVYARKYSANGWTEEDAKFSTISWYNYEQVQDIESMSGGLFGAEWITFNMTNVAKYWRTYTGDYTKGIMLHNNNESDTAYRKVFRSTESSDKPYVTVEYDYAVSQVCISETSRTLNIGESFALYASVLPAEANQSVIWWVDAGDCDVISVSGSGVVHAEGPGTATVFVQSSVNPSKYATCEVTVSTYYGSLGWSYMFRSGEDFTYFMNAPYAYSAVYSGFHTGIDLGRYAYEINGKALYSVTSGTVKENNYVAGAGRRVIIETSDYVEGTSTKLRVAYYHLQNSGYIADEVPVNANTVIGYVGSTEATAAHLHFSVIKDGGSTTSASTTLNPKPFFPHIAFTGNTVGSQD